MSETRSRVERHADDEYLKLRTEAPLLVAGHTADRRPSAGKGMPVWKYCGQLCWLRSERRWTNCLFAPARAPTQIMRVDKAILTGCKHLQAASLVRRAESCRNSDRRWHQHRKRGVKGKQELAQRNILTSIRGRSKQNDGPSSIILFSCLSPGLCSRSALIPALGLCWGEELSRLRRSQAKGQKGTEKLGKEIWVLRADETCLSLLSRRAFSCEMGTNKL